MKVNKLKLEIKFPKAHFRWSIFLDKLDFVINFLILRETIKLSLCAVLCGKACAQDSCLVRQALSGQDRAQDFCEVKALCGSCARGAFTA